MKRWIITIAAMGAAFALTATPALASGHSRDHDRTQDRHQDAACVDYPAECDQTQAQTHAQDCDAVQAPAGDQTQTRSRTQTGDQARSQAQTASQPQVKAQTALQAREHNQEDIAPEWAQKVARHKTHDAKHSAKRAHTIISN